MWCAMARNKAVKDVNDPVAFLKALRQTYWRGQSYEEMYDQLAKLLVAKIRAERTGVELTKDNAAALWAEIYDADSLPAEGPFFDYDDDRLQRAIDHLSRWKVSNSPYLWHVMHRAWLRHHIRRDQGQYYTPEFIKRFMVLLYPPKANNRICDPCGGSAGFIIEAADRSPTINPKDFYYFDIDGGQTFKAASLILSLYTHKTGHTLANTNMHVRDALAGPWPCLMDRIYTNVPFGIRVTRKTIYKDGPLLDTYRTGLGKASELSQVLFIEQCLRHLTPTGRFATVVDKGVVTNDKLREDRQKLLKDYHGKGRYLQLVVELPGVAFEYVAGTTFPTYLLFFSACPAERTYFARIDNPGYDDSGYVVEGRKVTGFPAEVEEDAWESSDWPKVLKQFEAGTLPSTPHADVLEGDWHYGSHKYRDYHGERLSDVADLVCETWSGDNKRNPTVDRTYRVLVETHLNPMKKVNTLRTGCVFMSRLVSDDHPPCCALVTGPFDGAGCTGENHIIRPKNEKDLIRLWYLINFDVETQTYLRMNARGQGRGRVLASDMLKMPVKSLSADTTRKAARVLKDLLAKASSDMKLASALLDLQHANRAEAVSA